MIEAPLHDKAHIAQKRLDQHYVAWKVDQEGRFEAYYITSSLTELAAVVIPSAFNNEFDVMHQAAMLEDAYEKVLQGFCEWLPTHLNRTIDVNVPEIQPQDSRQEVPEEVKLAKAKEVVEQTPSQAENAEAKPWEQIPEERAGDRKLVELLYKGYTDSDIAQKLDKSSRTVSNRLVDLRGKYPDIVLTRDELKRRKLK